MNKINVAIIEDEIPAARLLHSMVSGLRPQWELTLIPGSVDEAVAWFDEHPHPDLIFLDIHLADGNAFDYLSAAHPSGLGTALVSKLSYLVIASDRRFSSIGLSM